LWQTPINPILTANNYIKTHEYISVSAELYVTKPLQLEAILTSLNAAIHFDLLGVKNTDGTIPDSSIVMPTADYHNVRNTTLYART